jgi:hypothetical protein
MNTQSELSELQNYRQLNASSPTRRTPIRTAAATPISFVSAGVQNIAVEANDLENLQSQPIRAAYRVSSAPRSPFTWTASTTR